MSDKEERTKDGPEPVSAVADGVAEGKVFAEGQDGNEGDTRVPVMDQENIR